MNKFTLKFKNDDFEKFYHEDSHLKELEIFNRNMKILIIYGVIAFINNIYQEYYVKSIILAIGCFLAIILMYTVKKSYNLLDYSVFFMQLFLNMALVYLVLFQDDATLDPSEVSQFMLGLQSAYFQIGFLIGTRYYLKVFNIILFSVFILIYLYQNDYAYFEASRISFALASVVLVIYIYLTEKQKRSLFLIQHERQQWYKTQDSLLNVSIIQCGYNKNSRQIEVINSNQESNYLFSIQNVQNFKKLIRKTYISQHVKNYGLNGAVLDNLIKFFQLQLDFKNSKKKITLEWFLYCILSKPQEKKHKKDKKFQESIYSKVFQFSGYYEKQYLKILMFATYDSAPQITLIIQNVKDQEETIFLKQSQKISTLLNQRLLQQGHLKLLDQSLNLRQHSIFDIVVGDLYLQYNTILNVKIYQNYPKYELIISKFTLNQLLKSIQDVLKPFLQRQQIELQIQVYSNQDILFNSCYWMLYQILFNLLINSIKWSPKKSTVKVEFQLQKEYSTQLEYVKIIICDQGIKISQKQIDTLPVINPITIEEQLRFSQSEQIKLGLIVSNKLIQLIGKNSKLKLKNYTDRKELFFKILLDLELIPMSKFGPKSSFALKISQIDDF